MRMERLVRMACVGILLLPAAALAQESTLTGTIRDNTGGVLPGVTVTATNEAQGTTFVSVTDQGGIYRIPVRPGVYRVTAELSGFATIARPGVELLVGRQITLNLDMTVSGVQETVTVSGEAPLLDTTSSNIAGNIDPRQMQELPLNGRNWMDLTLLAPGSRQNASSEIPIDRQGYFQINVDGQQVTFTVCCSQNQPRYSRDAIAEFELTTNRFDATKGRTAGMMVNAITKSGTNTPAGTFSGFFRDDGLNAKDFIQDRVIPYQNQQVSGTFGGPIIRDRMHFFGNWEYEREPSTVTFNSPYPSFNFDLSGTRTENKGGPKVDFQFNPQNRMAVRYTKYLTHLPNTGTGGAGNHPSTAVDSKRNSNQFLADYTQIFGNNSLNQVKFGMASLYFTLEPRAGYSTTPNRRPPYAPPVYEGVFDGREIEGGTPRFNFSGYAIGPATNTPQRTGEVIFSFRDDFTSTFNLGGRHDVRFGVEYINYKMSQNWCNVCDGVFSSNSRPPANIETLFPVWDDAASWNLAVLSPLMRDYTASIGNFAYEVKRSLWASWYQDDWALSNRLTVNLGLRWDIDLNTHGERERFDPWLSGTRPRELDNVAPRFGFAFTADEQTVIRGGYGLFFTQLEDDGLHQSRITQLHAGLTVLNNGRPDFAVSPFGGPYPNYDQVVANQCHVNNNAPGCYLRSITIEIPMGAHDTSYSHMASIGVQRQLGAAMSFESNYVYTGGRKEEQAPNINLTWNEATGANYRFQDVTRRPFPTWGVVRGEIMDGRSNYHGWENSFTKRFSNRWQANATYTLAWFRDDDAHPYNVQLVPGADIPTVLHPVPFAVAEDIAAYSLASGEQRHRATFNGIWDMGLGFQLSGLYFFGSGQRYNTTWGGDQRNMGAGSTGRLRADGGIVPRNDFVGRPLHRVDIRLTKRQPLFGRATIDGMLEVFNLFNHENYGSYTTAQSNARYGEPSFNANVAFQPRIVQLGFRLAF